MKDPAYTTDFLRVDSKAPFVPAKFPCPRCGKESKEHNVFREGPNGPEAVPGARICSDRVCREEFNALN